MSGTIAIVLEGKGIKQLDNGIDQHPQTAIIGSKVHVHFLLLHERAD